jgi:hypothetical protein
MTRLRQRMRTISGLVHERNGTGAQHGLPNHPGEPAPLSG